MPAVAECFAKHKFDAPESRRPDPDRLVQAYFHSAATLNYLRASLASGLADLHAPLDWDLGHGALDPRTRAEYDEIVTRITDALTFMNSVGAAQSRELETADIYTSHEGLMLEYEEALTREVTQRPPRAQSRSPATASTRAPRPRNAVPAGFYATSGHFLWIGDRTRQVKGAHVEFFRGLQNPVGIKIGPSMEPVKLVELLDIVNPNREVGKVTLITRYGAANVEKFLPVHIRAVLATDHKVVWQCDPMHGNTRTTEQGVKTRSFDDVAKEVKLALIIHRQLGTYLGGLHLELTGEAVTECTGGAGGLTDDRLAENYRSFCDPRLNEKQALELAFVVARFHREEQARRDADEAGTEVLGVAA
ncbi:hypothetical protein KEM52_001493 [Ascosphaera acerosa]|nr:hypothetical protein KEM52_001493 [Ascosphaera acerosa]